MADTAVVDDKSQPVRFSHALLKLMVRPYVYNVHAHDLEGLKTAIATAIAEPIESFIPDYMKFDFVVQKMGEVIEMDWKGKAEALLAQRTAEGEGAVSSGLYANGLR